jgi:hypothetical protein
VLHHERQRQSQKHVFQSFSSEDSSPEAIYAASIKQLKHIVVMFRHSCPGRFHSIYLNAALIRIMNDVINDINEPDWRFYFLLCFCMMQDLYVCFLIFEAQMQGMLAMAMKKNLITGADARVLRDKFLERGKHHKYSHDGGSFAIDLDLAMSSMEDAKAYAMAAEFNDMTLFDEFTNDG